jgi:DNA repair protein RadD
MSIIGHNGGPAFQDRSYQIEAVASVWNYFQSGQTGNPVVAMPTGTGKSVIIARFLQSVFNAYPMQKIMVLTHVKELIQQNYEKLMMAWPFAPAGIYSAGLNKKEFGRSITFAGIASVAKKFALFGHIDLIIIDEVHLVSPNDSTMYQAFIAGLKSINPYLKVIGLTATPWRLGHGLITDPTENSKGEIIPSMFTDICFDITGLEAFNRLIAEGFLSTLVPKKTKTVLSTDGLHMRGGEFIEGEMQTAFDKEHLTEAALREAMELGADRRSWLIFASGTDHADHIGDMLNMFGVPTGVVHSKRAGRDETLRAFKRGELRAVVNNNVLTTGFDHPGIDLILCLRATASAVLWVQMLGRGTRPLYAPGFDLNTIEGRLEAIVQGGKENCLVLDYAGNTRRLGPINDPVVPKKKGQKGGSAPVKCCEVCDTWNHASVKYCGGQPYKTPSGCGAEFKFDVKFKGTAATDELIKGDLPVVEVAKVDHISFDEHTKHDTPPMVKVTYYCAYSSFTEYVCFEHQNFAGRKARQWWTARTDLPFPASTAEALEIIDRVKVPTHLRIWINKKYPEILAHCYDGTAFGTQEAQDDWQTPEVDVRKPRKVEDWRAGSVSDDLDDDIPF